ncbi:MAG: hypothetical protein ACFB9N_17115 [Geitlerinemataceae cyanobacterium]
MTGIGVSIVQWGLNLAAAYFVAGAVFAVIFSIFGVQRLDPGAKSWNTITFRIMILPGVCIFWPLLAYRLLRSKGVPNERNAHRKAAAFAPAGDAS